MFTYNADLQLESEMIDVQGGTTFDRLITRRYKDGSADGIPGQIGAVEVGDSGDPDGDYKVEYFHEPLASGRLTRVTGPGLPAYGAEYSYMGEGRLVSALRYKTSALITKAQTVWAYECQDATNPPHRDLVRSVTHSIAGSPVAKYGYRNDVLGRRTSVVQTEDAFEDPGVWMYLFDYNDRSDLTMADRYEGTDPDNPGQRVTPSDFDYGYDPIGNRTSWRVDADPATTYTTNVVNQYAETANPTATFVYDDGNLAESGRFIYSWDGENRFSSSISVRG